MICQKYIARCCRVYQHERNENASFLSILNGGGRPKWRFSNFPRFGKNLSALGSFNCIFENNSLKALFGQNIKELKILKLSPDSRYFQKLAVNCFKKHGRPVIIWSEHWSIDSVYHNASIRSWTYLTSFFANWNVHRCVFAPASLPRDTFMKGL